MAGIIQNGGQSGLTQYGIIRNSTGSVWDGAAFSTYNASNWSSYVTAMTEQGVSGYYKANFPAAIATAGKYSITIHAQSGGSPDPADPVVGFGSIIWDGSSEQSSASVDTAAIADAVWDEVLNVGSHNVTDSAAERVRAIDDKLPSGSTLISGFDPAAQKVNLNNDQSTVTIGTVNSLSAAAQALVRAQIVGALATDMLPELTGIPSSTPTIYQALELLYMALRNKRTASGGEEDLYNNAGASIGIAALSDDGTTFTKERFS